MMSVQPYFHTDGPATQSTVDVPRWDAQAALPSSLTLITADAALRDCHLEQGTKVCRYNWHSAGTLGWPFPTLKYKYVFHIKYTEAVLPNSTRKPLWFEITKMPIAV